MFRDAAAFNQPLNNWDVSSVTSMYSMFRFAAAFNQPLYAWDVSSVTVMSDMFRDAFNFNQDLSGWDVANVVARYNFGVYLSFANYPHFSAGAAGSWRLGFLLTRDNNSFPFIPFHHSYNPHSTLIQPSYNPHTTLITPIPYFSIFYTHTCRKLKWN